MLQVGRIAVEEKQVEREKGCSREIGRGDVAVGKKKVVVGNKKKERLLWRKRRSL